MCVAEKPSGVKPSLSVWLSKKIIFVRYESRYRDHNLDHSLDFLRRTLQSDDILVPPTNESPVASGSPITLRDEDDKESEDGSKCFTNWVCFVNWAP